MARRRAIQRRQPLPDPKYGNVTLARFINTVMVAGKKSLSESIVYGALDIVRTRMPREDVVKVFEEAVDNARPMLQVKSRRVGGATYQVPVEVASHVQMALAFRWIIEFSRKRSEKTMAERLAGELMDCFNKQGGVIKRREDTHKMAEANKAFAHLRY